jgi:hypothetical protein
MVTFIGYKGHIGPKIDSPLFGPNLSKVIDELKGFR